MRATRVKVTYHFIMTSQSIISPLWLFSLFAPLTIWICPSGYLDALVYTSG